MQPDIVCLQLHISGRVQGVGFRAALQDKAQALHLAGWVRNRRDGRVEALVQGPQTTVDAMRDWCHRGPPAARVDTVLCTVRSTDPTLRDLRCISTA